MDCVQRESWSAFDSDHAFSDESDKYSPEIRIGSDDWISPVSPGVPTGPRSSFRSVEENHRQSVTSSFMTVEDMEARREEDPSAQDTALRSNAKVKRTATPRKEIR